MIKQSRRMGYFYSGQNEIPLIPSTTHFQPYLQKNKVENRMPPSPIRVR